MRGQALWTSAARAAWSDVKAKAREGGSRRHSQPPTFAEGASRRTGATSRSAPLPVSVRSNANRIQHTKNTLIDCENGHFGLARPPRTQVILRLGAQLIPRSSRRDLSLRYPRHPLLRLRNNKCPPYQIPSHPACQAVPARSL